MHLDFPEVDWVVQFDCPKQLDDYIHRVGRTARAERRGQALMFLLPSEVEIIKLLSERNVQLRRMQWVFLYHFKLLKCDLNSLLI